MNDGVAGNPGPRQVDVVVVGAGAAGLMAAIQAARRGRSTVLLEKNLRPGLKILISGGGRCNLTTTRQGHELEAEYGRRRGRWLRHALRAFQPAALVEMIEAAGVPLREEDLDKIFPVSGRARDVLDALIALARAAGVELVVGAAMQDVQPCNGAGPRFVVSTPRTSFLAHSVVLATGGISYPKTGSTGDGYRVAQALGHGLVPPVPHLAPLPIAAAWVRELAGIVLTGPTLAAVRGGEVLCRRRRPILFTHKGLSGPAPMDLAGFVEECGSGCEVSFDLAPELNREQLQEDWLAQARRPGPRSVESVLPGGLPERFRRALVALAGIHGTLSQVSREQRHRLVELVKDLRLPVERSLGFSHAEVTRGGIPLDEVDARTTESRIVPGLFLCGEILDVDGPIGGFNFQAAFATGRLAGLHA